MLNFYVGDGTYYDSTFLKKLDNDFNKEFYIRIYLLDSDEQPTKRLEGYVTPNSTLSVDGNSAVRRTCSFSMFVEEISEDDLMNLESDYSMNKRISFYIGIKNNVDSEKDTIIWFKQGVFLINSLNITQDINKGVSLNFSVKDKMSLLNGDAGGTLPAALSLGTYDQITALKAVDSEYSLTLDEVNTYTVYKIQDKYRMWDKQKGWYDVDKTIIGETVSVKQNVYDIIQTIVNNYGGVPLSKIFINDIDRDDHKQVIRYIGKDKDLCYDESTNTFSYVGTSDSTPSGAKRFSYGMEIGYTYTDFVYPGELNASLNETVESILKKITNTFGNYEYFFDVDGNFIFQEKKNYLNTTTANNVDEILDANNSLIDFSEVTGNVYEFISNNNLISAYNIGIDNSNIKNDFHIWGRSPNSKMSIHYHLAIRDKPYFPSVVENRTKRKVVLRFKKITNEKTEFDSIRLYQSEADKVNDDNYVDVTIDNYVPSNWRLELYLQALEKKKNGIRPDLFEQELLDFFTKDIVDFSIKRSDNSYGKFNYQNSINELYYWVDFITPGRNNYGIDLGSFSVEEVGIKTISISNEKINKLKNYDISDIIFRPTKPTDNHDYDLVHDKITAICASKGERGSLKSMSANLYSDTDKIQMGSSGYSCEDYMREALYQHIKYKQTISLTAFPIYYLQPNTRITITNPAVGLSGDYIINKISLPLDGKGNMSISATQALERV